MSIELEKVELGPTEASIAAEVLKAIAHPLRLQIVSLLSGGEMHVKALAERLDVASAIVSQQLRILRSASLVDAKTVSGHAYYRITEPHLYRMLQCMQGCLASRGIRGEQ